jgi:hypothetical protein
MLGTAENNMIKAETIPILMANKVNAKENENKIGSDSFPKPKDKS